MSERPHQEQRKGGFPRLDRRVGWIGLAVITWLINVLMQANPVFAELIYSRGFFVLLRWIWDYTLGWLPVPLLYVVVPALLIFAGWKVRNAWANYRKVRWRYRIGSALFSLAAFASAVFVLFQWLWGFNYHRVPVEEQLAFPAVQPDSVELVQELAVVHAQLISLDAQLSRQDQEALTPGQLPPHLESLMRGYLADALDQWDYPTPGRVRGRFVAPDGFLLRMGASGIYIPFVGEGHVDAAMPGANRPFTLAHELAHGYGFGDEGTCNFLAFIATQAAREPAIRYSGVLAYWRYLMRQTYPLAPETYKANMDTLPPGIQADLQALRDTYQKYPTFFADLNRQVYHSYLQAQGVKGGIQSYNRLVELVIAWKKKAATT